MRWQKTILLGLVCLSLNLSSCARNSYILLQSEMRPIIPKGERFRAIWDNKLQEFEAEADKVVMDKGSYLQLQREANENAGK